MSASLAFVCCELLRPTQIVVKPGHDGHHPRLNKESVIPSRVGAEARTATTQAATANELFLRRSTCWPLPYNALPFSDPLTGGRGLIRLKLPLPGSAQPRCEENIVNALQRGLCLRQAMTATAS